ncbi:hypothetical protein [Amycolatopsis minnesotensis]|uniref:hypothetical protein n=1 Tax=Amycolatopsis minnesotensis TaxID=337894 RepID=UPI0031D5BA5A
MPEKSDGRLWTASYTSANDGRRHEVRDEEFHAARQAGRPPVALCGHIVVMSAAVDEVGAPCAACARLVARSSRRCLGVAELAVRLGKLEQCRATSHRRHWKRARRVP